MAKERQVLENKYETDIKEHFREITELKFNLKAEKIGRAELQVENHFFWNAFRAMELSLREYKN